MITQQTSVQSRWAHSFSLTLRSVEVSVVIDFYRPPENSCTKCECSACENPLIIFIAPQYSDFFKFIFYLLALLSKWLNPVTSFSILFLKGAKDTHTQSESAGCSLVYFGLLYSHIPLGQIRFYALMSECVHCFIVLPVSSIYNASRISLNLKSWKTGLRIKIFSVFHI